MDDDDLIINDIEGRAGSDGGHHIYMTTDTKSGESQVIFEQTVRTRRPITEIGEIRKLNERLNNRSGRRVLTIEQLADIADGKIPT